MNYPIDYDSYIATTEAEGIKLGEQVKGVVKDIIDIANDAYYQGRLDESLRGGGTDE